eukprot:582286-Pelagomonas_calceolata.AAC.3
MACSPCDLATAKTLGLPVKKTNTGSLSYYRGSTSVASRSTFCQTCFCIDLASYTTALKLSLMKS